MYKFQIENMLNIKIIYLLIILFKCNFLNLECLICQRQKKKKKKNDIFNFIDHLSLYVDDMFISLIIIWTHSCCMKITFILIFHNLKGFSNLITIFLTFVFFIVLLNDVC